MRDSLISKSGKLISRSSVLFKTSRLKIFEENHQLSNGSRHNFTVVNAPNWISIVPIDQNGDFLMVSQYRAAWQKASLEFPAGGLEGDEDFEDGAIRELKEETGYIANKWIEIGYSQPVTWSTQDVKIYQASDLKFIAIDPDPEEDIEVIHVKQSEFWSLVNKKIIFDSPTISSWGFWYNHNQDK